MAASIHRAVLLSAGRGERLLPLTQDRPKPMVPVAGRPLLERILRSLHWGGIEEAMIIHGYCGQVIEDYFGDGHDVGVRLQYRAQETLNGTAGAMLLAEEFCRHEPFLLHWGDILVHPANYPAFLDLYEQSDPRPACQLSMTWMPDPCAGGAVYAEGERVINVVEKPAPGTSTTHWQISGLMAFDERVWEYLHRADPPANGEFYVTQIIAMMLAAGEPVTAFEMLGKRIHLTSPENVAALEHDTRIAAWERLTEGVPAIC